MKWEQALIGPHASIQEALACINSAATQLALVVDQERYLLGTLSDGDVRRALLAGMTLTDPVERCMCRTPTTTTLGDSREVMLSKMRQHMLHQLPLVDDDGKVVGLKRIDDLLQAEPHENWVIIMAGGLGTRLKELTRNTPKPMLPVGNKPLLETIIDRFAEQGYRNIWLAVNYHADQIEAYFGNGAKFGANIRYLRETMRMGTAGALSLLPPPEKPILVSNADLLTKVDYSQLLDRHIETSAVATMAVREHEYRIPFGVVHAKDDRIGSLEEKPIHRVIVNAGIYVLSPPAVARIPKQTFLDMPEHFASLIEDGQSVRCHHVEDYWLDIGRREDLQQALIDYPELFE
ncbi:MAG: nucleotidyltransferase family protein [Nitrospirota bacterium]|nr:nucleotidyltransferase family protein [Nitrospirota bacterium]